MTSTQKFILIPVLALTVLGGGALLGYAQLSNADMNGMGRGMGMMGMHSGKAPGVHGVITALSGTTITLKGDNGTTYAIDASDAEVRKFTLGEGQSDVNVHDLNVGDTIGVRGEVDGTNVDATDIMTGDLRVGGMMGRGHGREGAHGEVISKNGTTLTVKTLNGETVTIDARDATVSRVVDGSLSDVEVGDQVGVHGTRDGNTITATHIMDDVKAFEGEDD
jgi:riboflavin synthase alpha subunit